jgi:signal transduction histidine kinase
MNIRTAPDHASVFSVLSRLIEVGFVVLSPDGEIDFASDRALDLLGCDDGMQLQACHPDAVRAIGELIASMGAGPSAPEKEVRLDLGGTTRHLSLTIQPIDEETCTGYILIVKDAENVRRMASDLRLAAQFRNTRRLSQAVVTDLKQPISAIKLHADLVRDVLRPENGAERFRRELRSLEVIRNQIGELNRALTLLLEEIDPADTEEQGFSLSDVVSDVVRLVEPLADLQHVEIEFTDCDHAARLNGSRQRVKQAVLHLAVNALDAMPEGGTLRVVLSVEDGRAVLRIADTGAGIDAHVLPHIFELHFTTKNTGTGVGLYVARDVLRRHGGSVDVVASEVGAGTTMQVVLPVSTSTS